MQTIIHIGAGHAVELDEWLKTAAQQIILVEPNPELAEELREYTSNNPTITVVEAAVTSEPNSNTLYEYNLSEASSLRPATGMKKLFPGLKTLATHTVNTLSPVELIHKYGPKEGEGGWLVIQAPGEVGNIIQALLANNLLTQFDLISLTDNPSPGYQDSLAIKTTLALLEELGYELTKKDTQDSDWPSWQLVLHPFAKRFNSLSVQYHVLSHEFKVLKSEKEQLQSNFSSQQQQTTELEQKNTALEAEKTSLNEKVSSLNASLAETKKSAAAKQISIDQLKVQIETLSDEYDEVKVSVNQLTKEKETLEKNKAKLEKTLNDKLSTVTQSAELKQTTITQLQTELTETKLSVQVKTEKLQQLEKQLIETKQLANAQQVKLNTQFQSSKKQVVEANAKVQSLNQANTAQKEEITTLTNRKNELKKQLEEAQQKIQLLETQLNAGIETQNGLSELQKQIEYLFNQNRLQLEQATNALGQHITHTGKQTSHELKTFVQCQQTLGHNT